MKWFLVRDNESRRNGCVKRGRYHVKEKRHLCKLTPPTLLAHVTLALCSPPSRLGRPAPFRDFRTRDISGL